MPHPDADRNLLFGINALQNDFITRDALIAAMGNWALAKHRPIGEILVEAGALDAADRDLLEAMTSRRVARHNNDPAAGLAALSSAGGVAEEIRRSIADPDVLQSVAYLPPDSGSADPYATRATIPPEPHIPRSRFSKLRHHAAGNLGVVYIARDEELNREVALKEIKERNADHLHSQAKFLLEAEVTGGLEHPGIVPVYGLGHHDDGRPFYAMRFIRGKSLLDAIKRFRADDSLKNDPGQRLLALQKLLRRFTDVCNAISYAHSRGVLHRDLKPDNVMVGKYGETLVVDWGLAKALGHSGEPSGAVADPDDPLPEASLQPSSADGLEGTQAGSLVGTPAYMSPEQAAGRLDLLGPASDIYGLGATLYHLIVGRPPISGTTLGDVLAKIQSGEFPRPRALVPWLDRALEAICLKAMALKPEARYVTPRALAEDLDRWIAGEPVAAYPEPWTRRARRWSRRHRTAMAVAITASSVICSSIGVGFLFNLVIIHDTYSNYTAAEDNQLFALEAGSLENMIPRSDELERKLQAIREQGLWPKDDFERINLANYCMNKKRYAESARFFGESFSVHPGYATHLRHWYRYNAACAASLAGSGLGKDGPRPDEADRAKLRGQAQAWLRADLESWSNVLQGEGGSEPARKLGVARTLASWKEDSDLAGIRDEAALAKLPEGEREAFRSLWADVEALRKKAAGAGSLP